MLFDCLPLAGLFPVVTVCVCVRRPLHCRPFGCPPCNFESAFATLCSTRVHWQAWIAFMSRPWSCRCHRVLQYPCPRPAYREASRRFDSRRLPSRSYRSLPCSCGPSSRRSCHCCRCHSRLIIRTRSCHLVTQA